MASICIDSILDELELLDSHPSKDVDLVGLKLEVRLLRTLSFCAKKWSKHDVSSSLSSSLGDSVQNDGQHLFNSLNSHRMEDGVQFYSEYFPDRVAEFREKIGSFNPGISEFYVNFMDFMMQQAGSSCSCKCTILRDEVMEFLDSLLEILVDFVSWGEKHFSSLHEIEPLEEKLRFLKNFICFIEIRGVDHSQLEKLLIHCEAVAVISAQFLHDCLYFTSDWREVFEILEKIKPVDPQVREIYIHVLMDSKSFEISHSLTVEAGNCSILVNFVDSLLGCLWELQDNSNIFVVSAKYQIQMLYKGLKFLNNILKHQQEEFIGVHEKTKDLIEGVIKEAGIVIFSLYIQEMELGSAREIDVALFTILQQIEIIKAEVAEKYPMKSALNYPSASEVDFIDLILENLNELASHEVSSTSFTTDRLQTVQEDLVILRTFFGNILEQCNQHEQLQALWCHFAEVAHKAELVIDTLMLGEIFSSSVVSFDTIKQEIVLLKNRALEIVDNNYVLETQKDLKTPRHVPSQGTISTINEAVVVLDDETQAIIDQLTRGSMHLDIVSIVGMPGLGKTTLARTVFHDPGIMSHFHIHAWCCISQVYCKKDLLLDILVCIASTNSDKYYKMNEDDLAEQLYKRLKGRRYVIVLDDVWDIEAWNLLERSFPDDVNGSRILLTSRLFEVALLIKPTGKPYPLRQLTDNECWELLQKKLMHKEGYPSASQVLGMQIAKNCNGLPLTVVIIAGILGTLELDGWKEVAERLSSRIVYGTDQCMSILGLSYQHLPIYLKRCLLHFGAFLVDKEIPVWRLMQLWIAEGFVQKSELKSMEEMAEDYMMALISRSLVMVAKKSSIGGVKTCCIHDLLHEFCMAKAKEENFLQLVRGYDELHNFDEPYNLHRLCVYSQRKHFVKSRLFGPHIHSLLFSAQDEGGFANIYSFSFIFRLKRLRVLDLWDINLGFHFPSEVTMLIQLRYLAVQGQMNDIPSSIANLSNLETFLLKVHNGSFLLPGTIWYMKELRHLIVRGDRIDFRLAKDILESCSCLYNLHTFATPKLYLGQSMEKTLKKFLNIRKLKCCLLESKESTEDCNKIVAMDFLRQLEALKLALYGLSRSGIEFYFPLNIKKLTLEDFSWSIISTIGKLPNLEVLKLHGDRNEIETWEMGEGEFPKLKVLKLAYLDILRWIGSDEHLPFLQKLVLGEGLELVELPSCLGYISTLELIEMQCCPDSLISLVREIEAEQKSMGNVDLKILS